MPIRRREERTRKDDPEAGGRWRLRDPGRTTPSNSRGVPMGDGKTDDMKGKVKEAAGDVTGDDGLKREGKVDKATGDVKDKVGDVGDKVKDVVHKD
jgi:uncharacterized protein YjbJ (UPF0337 family)